jgi:hypothetical protein
MYTLWYYSQEHDLEEFEYDEEGVLIKFINTLSSLDQEGVDKLTDDLYDSGMLDKILGPDFSANCGGWRYNVPCISFKTDGIQLELDREMIYGCIIKPILVMVVIMKKSIVTNLIMYTLMMKPSNI